MASNVQDAAARIAALVVEDNDGPTCDVFIPDRDKVRRRVLGEALTDFARAIVDEVRAPAEPSEMAATVLRHEPRIDPAQAREAGAVLERALADDVQCTDEELATALLAARGLASASPTGDGTLIARALLRMRAERRSDSQRLAAYRALLAADYALKRAFYHAPDGRQDALLDERSQARAEALAEALRVDREFAEQAMCEPEDDAGLRPPMLAADAPPAVPGMAESDARLRAEMAAKGRLLLPKVAEAVTQMQEDAMTAKAIVDEAVERIRRQRAALPAFFEANPDLAGCRCHANRDGDCRWE